MTSIQAREVKVGMLLERLDHTTTGRPAYVRAAVESIRPFAVTRDGPPWFRIVWSGGASGVYAPSQRFIIAPTPAA